MKWSEQQVAKLRELCFEEKSNKEIAEIMRCSVADIHAKRSQLKITIPAVKAAKGIKGISINEEFEKAVQEAEAQFPAKSVRSGMTNDVKQAFKGLYSTLILAMGSDRTSMEKARIYGSLHSTIMAIEAAYAELFVSAGTEEIKRGVV